MAYHITEDTPHMNKYIDFFEQLLIEDDWSYQKNTDGDRCYSSAHCRGKNTQKVLILEANPPSSVIMCFVYSCLNVPKIFHASVAELVCRINHRLRVGNFDFDFTDGEVRFRHAFDIEDGELTQAMVSTMRDNALITSDNYYPAFMAIMYGNKTAQEALAMVDTSNVEQQEETPPNAVDVDASSIDDTTSIVH